MTPLMRPLLAALLVSALFGPTTHAQSPDELPRRQYNTALGFMRQERYADAIHDLQLVVDSYPSSVVADDALLEIAKYQLDIARDLRLAQSAVDQLIQKYPSSDSAPGAYVVAGRILLLSSVSATDISKALAQFERVPEFYPASAAVPEALYWAGETFRQDNRASNALAIFRQVVSDYPTSVPWAARARLGAALCLVAQDQPFAAIETLQRIRRSFPSSPEAETALAWNTQMYRLYIRPPSQAAYNFSGKTIAGPGGKFQDVVDIAIDSQDFLHVLTRNGAVSFKPDGASGARTNTVDPRGLFVDRYGRLGVLQRGNIKPATGPIVPLQSTKPDGTPRFLTDSNTAVMWSTGDYLVSDPPTRSILRFSADGKWLGVFAQSRSNGLSLNSLDEVASLVREEKRVWVFGRDGKTVRQMGPRAETYELRDPVDTTFDALGNLLVLDRGIGSVMVFSPTGRLAASFAIAQKTPGNLFGAGAMTIDSGGRLFVYDEPTARVQIYE